MKKILITGCARSGTTYITNLLNVIGLKVGHEILRENGLVSWYNVDQPVYVYKNNIETISPKNSKKYHYGLHNRQPNNKKVSDHINTIFDNGWNEVYDFIIHQVRHPLKVISSMHTTPQKTWDYIMDVVPEINENDHLTIKCAKYWYYWNKKAEKLEGHLMRIEDIENNFSLITKKMGINKSFQEYNTDLHSLKERKRLFYLKKTGYEDSQRVWEQMLNKNINSTKHRTKENGYSKKHYTPTPWEDIENLDKETYNLCKILSKEYGYE